MIIFIRNKFNALVKYMEKGLVAATICQQPFLQDYKPLEILFASLLPVNFLP